MNNPGPFDLGSLSGITTPLTAHIITLGTSGTEVNQPFRSGLDGILAASLQVDFTYGAGGTNAFVLIQTRLDTSNWLDVARFDFTTASARKVANLSGLISKAVAAYAALSVEGVNDGLLGPDWRAALTTTGTYAASAQGVPTSVAARLVAR